MNLSPGFWATKNEFFDGTLSDVSKDGSKAKFSGDGFDTKLVRLVSSDKKGDKARLGIRPQNLNLNPKGKLVGRVLLVEKLGTETIIELVSKNKTSFRFTSPDIPAINIGEEARFSDAEHAHLFLKVAIPVMLNSYLQKFPSDFSLWGCHLILSNQGTDFGGCGRSHWDDFADQPGRVFEGQNGQIACDHYHRWPEDLDLVAEAGFDAYRFSFS